MDNIHQCGRIIDISELALNANEIKKQLEDKSAHFNKLEMNFVISHNNIVCCALGKRLYLTDRNFYPLIAYESNSFIGACSISANGKYVAFQMARNNENDEDSGATAVFDVKSKKIIAKRKLPTGFKGTRHIFIDEKQQSIFIYISDAIMGEGNNYIVKYDLALNPDEKTLQEYYTKPDISPYELNERINSLIEDIKDKKRDFTKTFTEINYLLNRLVNCEKMSSYQLSITYKNFGDICLEYNQANSAIDAYEKGLLLNPKLAVKKRIALLKK